MITMTVLREFLGWCTVMNFIFLYMWFFIIIFARDWLFNLHRRWFNLTIEQLNALHYSGMAIFKLGILLLNFTPYLALVILSR